MENIFIKKGSHSDFSWDKLGDIKVGRESLGEEVPVKVYRMLMYSMNSILAKEHGEEFSNDAFRKAGALAGGEFARNVLDLSLGLNDFIASLQATLVSMKVGILRMELYNPDDGSFVLTVGEDLDCSGLPVTNEVVCVFDEGFIAGIFEAYTGKKYIVREVDCWASGDRTCRFKGHKEV